MGSASKPTGHLEALGIMEIKHCFHSTPTQIITNFYWEITLGFTLFTGFM